MKKQYISNSQTHEGEKHTWSSIESWFRMLLQRSETRYLIIGGINTAISFVTGPALFYLLIDHLHYILIMVLTAIVNVTIAFLNYKFFVFKTKGNYVREYFRFYLVAGVPITFNFVMFPICYQILRMNPYLVQFLLSTITVILSYFGHKHFSFSSTGKITTAEVKLSKSLKEKVKHENV